MSEDTKEVKEVYIYKTLDGDVNIEFLCKDGKLIKLLIARKLVYEDIIERLLMILEN